MGLAPLVSGKERRKSKSLMSQLDCVLFGPIKPFKILLQSKQKKKKKEKEKCNRVKVTHAQTRIKWSK